MEESFVGHAMWNIHKYVIISVVHMATLDS